MSQKYGYGNWDTIKANLRNQQAFRFDWFIKSRTPAELGRRVESLIKMIEKEKEIDAHHKKVLQNKKKRELKEKEKTEKPKEAKKAKTEA